jgi:DegV family protein with EDD domain
MVYEEHFSKLLLEGKDVLHLAFSSGLSCTYESAVKAANKVNATSKNKVYVVDSLCACSGHGLYAIYVRRFAMQENNIEKIIAFANNIRYGLNQIFTVDSLKYLANGGRVKASTAVVGNMLNIKPLLRVDNKGHLENTSKVFGRKKSLMLLCEKVCKEYDPQYDLCFVSHADAIDDANMVADHISNNSNLQVIVENLGPVIGCHAGPGTIAIFYMANQR